MKQSAADAVGPFLSQPPTTGWAEAAVAAVMDDFQFQAVGALKGGVALAGVVAEEHGLDGLALVLGKGRLILVEEVNQNVVSQERYRVLQTCAIYSGDNL